ncbi:MAG: LysE family transporter, partial [Burkholderiales bacterium]|nr:LysE family transporter [Burkholderiales bacterium]
MLNALATIAVLHWAVLLVPGFNFVLLGQLAASGQRDRALAAVVGMTLGTLSWALLAVLGVGVVFAAHPLLREAVQVAGGLYLLQLAWKLWASAGATPAQAQAGVLSRRAAARVGFTTAMLNPKIALFYGSVFATALPPQPAPLLQAAAVVLVFANSVLWH